MESARARPSTSGSTAVTTHGGILRIGAIQNRKRARKGIISALNLSHMELRSMIGESVSQGLLNGNGRGELHRTERLVSRHLPCLALG